LARFNRAVALLAGLVLAASAGCGASGLNKAGGNQARQTVVLTLANFSGLSSELDGFAEQVRRLSAGTMRIDIKSSWRIHQVDFETGLIGDVRAGKADLGVVGAGAWDSVGVSSFRALDTPLLIDSYALQDRVVHNPMIGEMLQGLRPAGLAGIGVLPGPLRRPLGIDHPLLRPSDYAGLKIGVQQSRVAEATMRVLGARPVAFGSEGSIAGLDGIEQQISEIQENEYDRAGKYLTANVGLWPRPLVLFASRKAWAALTPAERRVLRQAATADQTAETQGIRDVARVETAILCRRGLRFLTASPADLAALRRAVQPVFHQLERDPQTQRYIRQIEAMRKGVAAESAPGCGHTARPAGKAGPLDGVWQFTTTPADLRAAGAPQGDIVPENYGTYTFVIDRGRFAFTQENRQACTWAYGSFTVKGDRFEQLFTDGGGIAPDGAANKPGELFTFRWSLYRGMLTLYPVKGAVSPNPSVGKPWPRISTTPSPRFLSKRCPPPSGALPP
jgi:TRAP-type C4-dicarboxylate transport system substrate-binding protein